MEMHNVASTKVTKVGLRKDTIFLPPRLFFTPLGANASILESGLEIQFSCVCQ